MDFKPKQSAVAQQAHGRSADLKQQQSQQSPPSELQEKGCEIKSRRMSLCILISGWWARATPLKNMSSSIGMMRFPIVMGKYITCSKPPTRYKFLRVEMVFPTSMQGHPGPIAPQVPPQWPPETPPPAPTPF